MEYTLYIFNKHQPFWWYTSLKSHFFTTCGYLSKVKKEGCANTGLGQTEASYRKYKYKRMSTTTLIWLCTTAWLSICYCSHKHVTHRFTAVYHCESLKSLVMLCSWYIRSHASKSPACWSMISVPHQSDRKHLLQLVLQPLSSSRKS